MEPIHRIWVPRKNFMFENAWCVAQGITDIVSESWLSSAGMQVVEILQHSANDLGSWSKANDNGLKQEIDDCRQWRCQDPGSGGSKF